MPAILLPMAVFCCCSMLVGCPSGNVNNPDAIVFPDSAVSFRNHVLPFFTLRCYPCHDEYNAAGGIRLSSYSTVMFDRPNLAVPYRPDESLLIKVLERQVLHTSGNIENVPSAQTRGMRTWISEGAQNN